MKICVKQMGYELPGALQVSDPNRTGCVVVGPVVFVSGHGRDLQPLPGVKAQGQARHRYDQSRRATRRRAPSRCRCSPSLKMELGDLDRVKRVVRLFGMVNVGPGFDRMPNVIDGASDFFYELLGPEAASMPAPRSVWPSCRTGLRSRSTASSRSRLPAVCRLKPWNVASRKSATASLPKSLCQDYARLNLSGGRCLNRRPLRLVSATVP